MREYLVRVAGAVASGPPGTAVLAERRVGDRFPCLSVHPADLESLLTRSAEDARGRLVAAEPVTSPPAGASWVGYLAAAAQERTTAGPRRPDPPGSAPAEPRSRHGGRPTERPWDTRFAVQCHWFPAGDGRLRTWVRFRSRDAATADRGGLVAFGAELLERAEAECGGRPAAVVEVEPCRDGGEFERGSLRSLRGSAPLLVSPPAAAALLLPALPELLPGEGWVRHTVVVGATGSGKTRFVARSAADRIRQGTPVIAFDVHGDLSPSIVALLRPHERERVLAIDGAAGPERIPGLAVLGSGEGPGREADAAAVVAALKRLSPEPGEIYWGFRLERIFDTLVRLAQSEGGSLADVAALLTDERRREAARWRSPPPPIARFLEELPAILRRTPDFLWPAAARLAKVTLSPSLAALVAPVDEGLPLEEWFARGGSVLWRLPFADLGPEGAAWAGTLLATRSYLAIARSRARAGRTLRALFVFDEAQAFSARLLSELLAEGRKFGIGVLVATQYPERLAPELRAAAAGAAGRHLLFRVPAAAAPGVGAWAGLDASAASAILPGLPIGSAVEVGPLGRSIRSFESPGPVDRDPWESLVTATSDRLRGARSPPGGIEADGTRDLVLLELVGATRPRPIPSLIRALAERSVDPVSETETLATIEQLVRRGWLQRDPAGLLATASGAAALGLASPTGATRESAEHRALVHSAFRILARRGVRLEIVRQGRFDTRLPDAALHLAPEADRRTSPEELYRALGARRATWAWRYFHGRDVHVEAEVWGAERRDRVLRGLAKAERVGAFALFLVSSDRRARRVRSVLADAGAYPQRASVWTLRDAAPSVGTG